MPIKVLKPLIFLWLLAVPAAAEPFSFVALGDVPYGDPVSAFPPYEALIANINAEDPELVIHVGDLHGRVKCEDALMAQLLTYLNSFEAPVLYTPGDNEWTDCHRDRAGNYDPLERLDHLRRTYFADPDQTLGATPVARDTQAALGYPENGRLQMGAVGFVTVHVVGSNNNNKPERPGAAEEYQARTAANVVWLRDSFAAMPTAEAYVVALHADMFFPDRGFDNGWKDWSSFRDIGVALGELSSAVEKPVLLLFGDSHKHRQFQPFPQRRPYLHAIEVYGHPDIAAIEIEVVPEAIQPFRVTWEFRP